MNRCCAIVVPFIPCGIKFFLYLPAADMAEVNTKRNKGNNFLHLTTSNRFPDPSLSFLIHHCIYFPLQIFFRFQKKPVIFSHLGQYRNVVHFFVEDWFLSAMLGIITATLSISTDVAIEYILHCKFLKHYFESALVVFSNSWTFP